MNELETSLALRLTHFKIQGLFGEHDYVIPLNTDEHVTAIIAPNGSGKTLCLRLISAFFKRKWGAMMGTEFESLEYHFSNGTSVTIEKIAPADVEENDEESVSLRVAVRAAVEDEPVVWAPKMIGARRKVSIERYLPFMTRAGTSSWRHDHTGQLFDFPDLIEEFGEQLPESIKSGLWGDMPSILEELTDSIDCRLIETQRLLVLDDDRDLRYYGHRPERTSTLAITKKAQALKNIISREINAYAAYSQSLDRTFPHRVILDATQSAPESLEKKLADLDEKRTALMQAGILDTQEDEPVALPDGTIDPAVARVLQMYAIDTQKKLDTLQHLLDRINLFKKLIAQRFTTKDVLVDREHGIFVNARHGRIPLDKLSSGEQHQLVLFFELLFEIDENSLILIDEPELSLHVAWQKKFIGDLLSIIDLNKFDVILATHSPQLISHWEGLVIELGDVFAVPEDSKERV